MGVPVYVEVVSCGLVNCGTPDICLQADGAMVTDDLNDLTTLPHTVGRGDNCQCYIVRKQMGTVKESVLRDLFNQGEK